MRTFRPARAGLPAALALLLAAAVPAGAETELSIYSGLQTATEGRASGTYPGGFSYSGSIDWEGRSTQLPAYYGARLTFWRGENFGLALEGTHAKAYAPEGDRRALGFDRMEFTDGLNIITLNAMYRWPGLAGGLTPYVGAGAGLSIPHVDAETAGGVFTTYGYQVTGPAVRAIAGASYDINDSYAVFGEYQFTRSWNEAELEGGGTLDADISTHAVNFGLAFRF